MYSRTIGEHQQHLQAILQVLQGHDLRINKKKCNFGQTTLEYLGHIISCKGVEADPSKLEAVSKWPRPQEVKGLRGFLGLTGYYRRLYRDMGRLPNL